MKTEAYLCKSAFVQKSFTKTPVRRQIGSGESSQVVPAMAHLEEAG
jgi:hypothetical protein